MINTIIVEDDPMVMEINRQYMERIPGTKVLACFRSGSEAWEYLKTNDADLVLIDVYMPEMTGLELLRKIRGAGSNVDVIMVTANNSLKDIKTAMSLGIVDYLIKPFEFDRFRTAVERSMIRQELTSREDKGVETLSQDDIDALIRGDLKPREKEATNLEKGIQANTLETLLQCLKFANEDIDCESLATASHLSKVTVRRYMNYLIENDQAESIIDYQTGGRPGIRYRIKR